MGDDAAAKREEERLMRAFGAAKSPRSFAPKPAAAAAAPAPQPAASKPAPAVTVAARSPAPEAKPAAADAKPAAASTIPARPGPAFPKGKPAAVTTAATGPPTLKQGALETAQVAPTNLGGAGGNVYTSAKISTLRGRKDVARGLQIWQGKMLDDETKLRLAQDGGYTGLEQLLQHNALDVRNLAKEAVLQLETAPGSGEIGTFTAEKLSPLVKLFTSTDNILVRQLALWDLATMASVPESRKAIIEKFGLDVTSNLVNDPETEIAAAAATLLGNLAQDDGVRPAIFKEEALAKVLALGRDRKDPKAICAVSFAIGNFSLDEEHARKVVQAGGLAWVLQQLSSGDPEILRTAWGAISTLAKYDFARQEILNAGGLKSLVHVLKTTKDDLTFQYATQAAVNMCLDGGMAERFIQEGGLLALERVNDDSFDLLCTKQGLVKKPTPSVYAVQLRVATTYRNIAKANPKCRELLRARQDSVAIVRSLSRSDQEKIAAVAKEALALLESDADAKAEAEAKARQARAAAEAEEARKKAAAAEEELRRQKAVLAEEERKKVAAAAEEATRKAAEADAARKRAADALEESRRKAAAEEEARKKVAADEARRKALADEEARRKALADEERKRREEAEARDAKLKADLEAERKRLETERAAQYERERKAREEAEARARQLEDDRRRKEEELRLRLDREDQERRDKWRREEEERRRADDEARKRTEEDMRRLEEMQRRLAEERRRLDDAKRLVETAPAVVVVKERAGLNELPVEPIKEESKPAPAEEKKVYRIDRIIAEMLEGLDLSRYEPNFAHNDITFDQLFALRDKDLREMGIDAVGPRARILQAIGDLYADSLGKEGDAAMRRLIEDLDSRDPNVVQDALERLLIVAERSSANRNALIVLDLIAVLIRLIRKTRYIEVQGGAMKILASLCKEARAAPEVRNCKGLEPIVYLVNYESWKDDLETLAHVLLCVQRLANDRETKRQLRELNFMPQVVHIVAKDEQPAVRALALEVLAVITTEDRANQEALWNTNMALNYINAAFESNDAEVKEAATRAIGSLAGLAYQPFQDLIWTVPFDIPNRLVKLTRLHGEEALQATATLALAYLSEDHASHADFVLKQGVIRSAAALLRGKQQSSRANAAAAIRVLARGDKVRRSVANTVNEACVVGPLCELAAFSDKDDVQREALGALFELTKDSSSIQKVVFASLGPQPLLTALRTGVPVMQYYSAGIFYNVSRACPGAVYEMNTAGVEPLVRSMLESTDFNLRVGAEALERKLASVAAPGPISAVSLAQ